MSESELQQQLFLAIKSRLATDASVADEIAALPGIITDSVYRRMRGEKALTYDELYKIATQYRISIDQLMNINTGAIMFQGTIFE